MLQVENLSCRNLAPVSFTVDAGESVAVTGASGAGKSLLLRSLADLDPNDGEIFLDGRARSAMPAPAWRRRVVYVPAESGWWADHVGPHFAARDAAAGFLHRLQLPAECMEWPVARLSTGERQRLALVRAMVLAPTVMLLDEPTSGLDHETTLRVEGVLHERLTGAAAIIFVSHDKAQADRFGRRRLHIEDGVIEEVPTEPRRS